MYDVTVLKRAIERSFASSAEPGRADAEAMDAVSELRRRLSDGSIRAAEPRDGTWSSNAWVKKGILLGFRVGETTRYEGVGGPFFDKDSMPPRRFSLEDGVRLVPGGTAIREGAYVAPGVVCMPPSYVNVGAYVGEGTMIDSHVLVGSCAQIGRHVHLSAGVQIGGVLEPPNALPVVVEDGVFVGAQSGLFEGAIVRRRAVIAPGVTLTRSTPVFDLVEERVLRAGEEAALEIPAGAVVIPGSRPASGGFASRHGLHMYAPLIVKYRDESTDASVALESLLRDPPAAHSPERGPGRRRERS